MSHISKIEIEINDLNALKKACQVMGLEFAENQKSFTWYSGKNPCSHAIKVPGANYEVGIIQNNNKYELQWDNWSSGGLVSVLGDNACHLKKHYSLERVKNEARKKRYQVKEQNITGGTRLILTT